MNKNFAIRPSVHRIDGQLIETYERKTNASPEQLEELGLDPNIDHYSRLGIASVNEYVRLVAYNIQQGTRHEWKIADLGTDVEIDNVYIQVPTQDSFDLEIYDANGNQLLDLAVGRSRELQDLPDSVLTQDLTIKLYARANIGLAVINCRPAVLLGTLYSNETLAAMSRG